MVSYSEMSLISFSQYYNISGEKQLGFRNSQFFLSTILFVILLIPLLPIFLLFFIYRIAIYVILRIKFGPKFWGLLNGFDLLFSMEGSSKNILCMLITVRTKSKFEDFMHKFREQVKTKIFENPNQFSKLLATRHRAFGFYYLLKNQVKVDDCVGILHIETKNEEISKEELLTHMDKSFTDLLPCNHTGLWELLVCEKPLKSNKANKIEQSYAILARIHHTVGDGNSLLKFFLDTFAESNQDKNDQNFQEASQNLLVRLLTKIQDILFSIFLILISPLTILRLLSAKKPENNSWNLSELRSENILVAKVEEISECIKIIKNIKKRNNGATFSHVLIAAISKSFSNYFQKKNKDPNLTSITASITASFRKPELSLAKMQSMQLQNNFSFATVNIPIIFRKEDSSPTKSDAETLEDVKTEFENVKNLYHFQITSGFFKFICSVFPVWIIVPILGSSTKTLFITNVPGPSLITAWNGSLIENIIVWIPNIGRTGIALSIFSYNERLQIALTANKALITQREEAQNLVDGIHQAIIQLDSNI